MTETTDVRLFPPPGPLATPTDLGEDDARKVTEAVNPLVADAFALYVKTKNYHWHLSGARFGELHELFDAQAEEILSFIDPMAERIRKIGGTTIRSISHISSLQNIEDDNEDFLSPDEMIRRLMQDNRQYAANQRQAHEVCESAGDVATASLLEDVVDETEKRTWFLFEYLQDTDRFD